mmetsp:Transcript_16457/g.28694  ORF Transcript_16457/g.28694 Transcript_16457/m.28694 type:complete len:154 (+) Transcript_16457:152-613(+)
MRYFFIVSTLLLSVLVSEWFENAAARLIHATRQAQEEQSPLVGGYKKVENLQDPMIAEAATFALKTVQDQSVSPYSFGSEAVGFQIIDAWEQVVAGINIRMALMFQDGNDNCVGACSVTVYNHFGTLSVSNWNKEVTCREAKEMTEQKEGNED